MLNYDRCVNLFIDNLRNPHTAECYRIDLQQFGDCLEREGGDLKKLDVTQRAVRNFIARLIRQSYSPSSVVRKHASVNSFFGYLVREKLTENNPAEDVYVERVKRKPLKTLSSDIIEQLTNSIEGTHFRAERDRTILKLLHEAGLLVSEVVQLNQQDINIPRLEITIKGPLSRKRTLSLDRGMAKDLKAYLSRLKEEKSGAELFPNKYGKRLTTRSVARIVKECSKRINIEGATPRTLRHSFAKRQFTEGKSLEAVRKLMGHSQRGTTLFHSIQAKPSPLTS